ncbi:hypothetical protein TRIXIE_86 [Mycobacterium phage Trixie]|uniref:Uncharacterized protein n=1 Tax=Mycobacterium phage Trixie TaxID=1071503 RepID=G1JV44_9CAUD|nr:hypothetical protein TRIXIE_86 [Mycobacterium phage Trixie]AEL17874.1 hypothetical protein TRIXIE_86 [Mycobacterium phage Trixie]
MEGRRVKKRLMQALGTIAVFTAALGAMALADPYDASAEPVETTTVEVDRVMLDFPVCAEEDCSDQPGQIGVWRDRDGTAWLSLGEQSFRIER